MGMTTTPQDDVTRRMEALIALLKAAGTTDDNNAFLVKETERCKQVVLEPLDDTELPPCNQGPWDQDILAMTQQLEQCRQETPEKLEIGEAQPARVTYKPTERRPRRPPRDDKRKTKTVSKEEPSIDRREQLSQEMSEMSYPKIGPGYSDTISVTSDLSIPTVVTNLHVPEEEYYRDVRPPLHIGVSAAVTKRQPSIGSNMMIHPTPDREDVSTLMAPTLIAPSDAAPILPPSIVATDELRAPSQRVVSAPKRPGGAAAQRRQTHQAVLAHLQNQQNGMFSSRRNSTGQVSSQMKTLTVNDLPPHNIPNDEASEYMRKPIGGKRRSLLSRGNKYAASVTATSTRMLLSKQKQTPPNPKRASLLNRSEPRSSPTENSPQSSTSPVDLDGVLSTMNCDIDFIFQELSVLEDSALVAPSPSRPATLPTEPSHELQESNIGSTAKIKYTLTSVARTLRHKENSYKKDDSLSENNKDSMSWGSLDKNDTSSITKPEPVLIDEDGFIVTNDGDADAFADPFASKNGADTSDPFANAFFPAMEMETAATKKKNKRRSTTKICVPEKAKQTPQTPSVVSPESIDSKESRIDAVEMATKKRIEMLRNLVEYRAKHVSGDTRRSGREGDELEKLDFVEAETMKQIARLRERLGASRRELWQQ